MNTRTTASLARLYATDASVYQQLPRAVVCPKDKAECVEIIKRAGIDKTPLIPRAAGTSIAGQCVGDGVVVDISRYMTQIIGEVSENKIRVQSGVILDDLNDYLQPTGLKFAPDISTSNRCMIAGMIGNNAAGSHSVIYGTTRDHIEEIEVILSDGSTVCFKPLTLEELEEKKQGQTLEGAIYRKVCDILDTHRDVILKSYPKPEIIRRNTGYALDYLANLQPWNPEGDLFNLAPLIAGSEGTLAFIVEATLKLIPRPKHRLVVCSHFDDLNQAMESIELILQTNPAAVELMDKRILDLSAQNIEQSHNRFWVQGDPVVVFVTEYFAGSQDVLQHKAKELVALLNEHGRGYAHPIIQEQDIGKVWAVRKAGLGLLMGVNSRRKPVAVIEDTAVATADLADYVRDIQQVMRRHKVDCVYYGHTSVGLIHLRPELDLSQKEDKQIFKNIASDVADLVKKYRGSLSGEHGDGRVRGPFLKRMIGEKAYRLNQEIKAVFDPQGIFNPEKIITDVPIDADLRADVSINPPSQTGFDWSSRGGLGLALEKCNGVGACRKSVGRGVMCPTYQATKDERFSTRGRSNLLRFAFLSDDLASSLQDPLLNQVLESCLGCKACKSECPSNVDMSRLRSEALYQKYRHNKIPFKVRLSAYYAPYLKLASRISAIVNFLQNTVVFRSVLGVDKTRKLPKLALNSASAWWTNHEKASSKDSKPTDAPVLLLVDIFSNYLEPEITRSAIYILEKTGHQVIPVFMESSPRQLISKGLLSEASTALVDLLKQINGCNHAGIPLIGLEPSELLTLRDEAIDLVVSKKDKAQLSGLKDKIFLLDEYLLKQIQAEHQGIKQFFEQLNGKGKELFIHTHCHQKTLSKNLVTKQLLEYIPQLSVSEIPSGCCGMAGQFGYEQAEFSKKIAETTLKPHLDKLPQKALILASGASCRCQIESLQKNAMHIAQIIRYLQIEVLD